MAVQHAPAVVILSVVKESDMRAILICICMVALSGCAANKERVERGDILFFIELGMGWQNDAMTDQLVQTTHKDQCEKNMPFSGEFGVMLPHHWQLSYEHESWWFCGGPFNEDLPEIYSEEVWLKKRWIF